MSFFSNIKQHYIDKRMQKIDAINQDMQDAVYQLYYSTYVQTRVASFGKKALNEKECAFLKEEVEINWLEGIRAFIDNASKADFFRNVVLKSGIIPSLSAVSVLICKFAKILPDNLIVNSVVYGLCAVGLGMGAKTMYDIKNKCTTPTNLDFAQKALDAPCDELYLKAENQFRKDKASIVTGVDQGEEDNKEHFMYF